MDNIHFFYLETGELIGLNKTNQKQAMIEQSYDWIDGEARRKITVLSIPTRDVLSDGFTNINSAKKFVRGLIRED